MNPSSGVTEGIGGIAATSACLSGDSTYTSAVGQLAGTNTESNPTYNIRQRNIHGVDMSAPCGTIVAAGASSNIKYAGCGKVPNSGGNSTALATLSGLTGLIHRFVTQGRPKRRYQVQLALGLFQQEKLIPTKFMASQLAIEITLENASACMYYQPSTTWTTQPGTATTVGTPAAVAPSYIVDNVNLIPEILEFDASYDETFLRGLQTGGVPIKFSTWNNYRFSQSGVSSINLQIQERSRSVKAIFCMQRRDPATYSTDSGACFFNSATGIVDGASTLQEFQFRIGGR